MIVRFNCKNQFHEICLGRDIRKVLENECLEYAEEMFCQWVNENAKPLGDGIFDTSDVFRANSPVYYDLIMDAWIESQVTLIWRELSLYGRDCNFGKYRFSLYVTKNDDCS